MNFLNVVNLFCNNYSEMTYLSTFYSDIFISVFGSTSYTKFLSPLSLRTSSNNSNDDLVPNISQFSYAGGGSTLYPNISSSSSLLSSLPLSYSSSQPLLTSSSSSSSSISSSFPSCIHIQCTNNIFYMYFINNSNIYFCSFTPEQLEKKCKISAELTDPLEDITRRILTNLTIDSNISMTEDIAHNSYNLSLTYSSTASGSQILYFSLIKGITLSDTPSPTNSFSNMYNIYPISLPVALFSLYSSQIEEIQYLRQQLDQLHSTSTSTTNIRTNLTNNHGPLSLTIPTEDNLGPTKLSVGSVLSGESSLTSDLSLSPTKRGRDTTSTLGDTDPTSKRSTTSTNPTGNITRTSKSTFFNPKRSSHPLASSSRRR